MTPRPSALPTAGAVSGLFDARLLMVSGKGGVGKSTVAAALAVAGARTGRTTCLVEVERRQTFSRLFGTQPWDYVEREFRPGLWGLAVDPEASLREYLDVFYGARRLSRFVTHSAAVEFATTAAPGIKDVLLIGKLKELERRREPDGRFSYDLVVVDAPPTGRIANFLRAPDATTELIGVGPVRQQAQSLIDMLLDPDRTRLALVTLLEEMPVAETVDSARVLTELGVTLGPTIVNRVLPERFDEASTKALEAMGPDELASVLATAEVELGSDGAAALLRLGAAALERLALQRELRAELCRRLPRERLELPDVPGEHFGDAEIGRLADVVLAAVDR